METVIVEREFDEPQAVELLAQLEAGVSWCLEMHRVRPLHSYVSRDGRRMICVYEAPDAEAVRRVQETAKMPFRAVWSADLFPDPDG
jgi:hypothetical protein